MVKPLPRMQVVLGSISSPSVPRKSELHPKFLKEGGWSENKDHFQGWGLEFL